MPSSTKTPAEKIWQIQRAPFVFAKNFPHILCEDISFMYDVCVKYRWCRAASKWHTGHGKHRKANHFDSLLEGSNDKEFYLQIHHLENSFASSSRLFQISLYFFFFSSRLFLWNAAFFSLIRRTFLFLFRASCLPAKTIHRIIQKIQRQHTYMHMLNEKGSTWTA